MRNVNAYEVMKAVEGTLGEEGCARDAHYSYLELLNDVMEDVLEYAITHDDYRTKYIKSWLDDHLDYWQSRMKEIPNSKEDEDDS